MEQIENKLLDLVKGCINDREFMTETKETTQKIYNYGYSRWSNAYTGVTVSSDYQIISEIYENDSVHATKTKKDIFKIITLIFENEPKIEIKVERVTHQKNVFNITETLLRESNGLKEHIVNFFKSRTYIKHTVEEIITNTYEYKLVCGEFKISVSNEEVDELVKLYEANTIKFKKEAQAIEIEKRIKKYVK